MRGVEVRSQPLDNPHSMWLGDRRGYLTDWLTQRWVRATGRLVDLERAPWLDGPIGATTGIGPDFVADLARSEGLVARALPDTGLVPDFTMFAAADFDPAAADAGVVDFYTRTAQYELDSWAEWSARFRPFGGLLAHMFSRRLQQLNVPLTGLDTSRGVTSEVVQLIDPRTQLPRFAVWLRRLVHTDNVLYAGCYSVTQIPGRIGSCVRVVFPLPNGNAMVLMRPKPTAQYLSSRAGARLAIPGSTSPFALASIARGRDMFDPCANRSMSTRRSLTRCAPTIRSRCGDTRCCASTIGCERQMESDPS